MRTSNQPRFVCSFQFVQVLCWDHPIAPTNRKIDRQTYRFVVLCFVLFCAGGRELQETKRDLLFTVVAMVNVRCQACQAKYRLLAAKRVNLLGLVLEARPIGKQNAINYDGSNSNGSSRSSSYNNVSGFGGKPAPRFPYRPPIQRRPRSYILPPPSPTVRLHSQLNVIITRRNALSPGS